MTTQSYSSPACLTTPDHKLKMVTRDVPRPGKGQVLVHVKATGICGSDIHFWKHGGIGDMLVKSDCGLGHESAGIVEEIGEGVTLWKKGDRVAIEPGVPCGKASCYFCRSGRYNACPEVVFFSTPPDHGLLTRYHLHPEAWLHKLPDDMSFEEGSMLEPLSVALAGIQRSGLSLGDELFIAGAGPIGLVSLLCARAAGANPIVISDISEARLEFAKTLVPSVRTLRIDVNQSTRQIAQSVKVALENDLGPRVSIECTGIESSVNTAILASRFGGTVFVIGVGRDSMNFEFMHASKNEIDLKFQFRYHETWPKAISLVSAGLINLQPLVTHRFSLGNSISALECAADPSQVSLFLAGIQHTNETSRTRSRL